MQSFSDAFRRNVDGSWICLEPATIQGPGARIEAAPGDIYPPDTELAEFLAAEDAVRAHTAEVMNRRRSRHNSGRRP
jgi:hypothetical protein